MDSRSWSKWSSRQKRWLTFPLLIFSTLLPAACDRIPSTRAGDTIPSELFIEAVVELRSEALRRESGYLLPVEAASILAERGLEPEALTRFVDTHGRDVPLMTAVWTEVERRIRDRIELGGIPPQEAP
jgi:hypothetical protein